MKLRLCLILLLCACSLQAGGRLRVMMRGGGVQQENPSAPTGFTPVHGASSVSISALLQWNPSAGATSYDVYLDTVSGSTLICNDVVGTSCDPTLDYSTTYYAKVCSNPGGACTGVQSWTTEAQGAKAVIQPSDIEYLGLFTVPNDPVDQDGKATRFGYSKGQITGRYVDGQLRFFITGSLASGGWNQPLYEITYPGYGATVAGAPRATLVRSWGSSVDGLSSTVWDKTVHDPNGSWVSGMRWDGEYLWWTVLEYYSSNYERSIGATRLNEDGTVTAYGPWRTTDHHKKTGGWIVPIPSWFQTAYVPGSTYAIGTRISSVNSLSPWGAALYALNAIVPTATAADSYEDTNIRSAQTDAMVIHDINHPMTRDTLYVSCGWTDYPTNTQPVECAGTPLFGGSGSCYAAGLDMITAAEWIDLPTKHGVVFFGQLVHPLDENDVQDPHVWYGGTQTPTTYCGHNRASTIGTGTGPHAERMAPYMWIFDPMEFAKVLNGTYANPYTPQANSATNLYGAYQKGVNIPFYQNGAWFDATTNLLFVSTSQDDTVTNSYEPRPVIRVFRVN